MTPADVDPRVGRDDRWVWPVRHLVVCSGLAAFCLNSSPGMTMSDTKLDLVLNPGGFLERAMHLWDPLGSAGQLQNQAYGYLFPMGPFFLLGHLLRMPDWVVQRLWWVLILAVAHLGFVALARRLDIGTDWTRLVGGAAFALAPHVLTVISRSSIEAWPPALAPWVLVPLVGRSGMVKPRRAAALSGLAILCMGGVNASVDVAATLPAILFLATRARSRVNLRLAAWWLLASALATAWWVLPLLVMGRYSPPFLDFIESASFTTSTTSLVETLRGTSDWVAYLFGSGARAGYALLTDRAAILNTVLITALGLFGLTVRRVSERRWLILCLTTGGFLVSLGHASTVSGFFDAGWRSLLDGDLAPIRNVHKFDILIRLPLMLGLTAALSALAQGRTKAQTQFLRPLTAAIGAFLVVGAAAPFFALGAAPAQSFAGVPPYWTQAGRWLTDNGAEGRSLLLPGTRFGDYEWGYPADEPIQSLSDAPWDLRNAVPLTEPGHVRWLDAIERRVAAGIGGPDLAPALAAGGISYVVLRNDINYGGEGATRPAVARAVIDASAGLTLVAEFGPGIGGPGIPGLMNDQKLRLVAPAIEIYRVDGSSDPRLTAVAPSEAAVAVSGAEDAAAPAGRAVGYTISSPIDGSDARGSVVLTDTPARRETNPGVGTFGQSYTMAQSDRPRVAKKVRDYGASDVPGSEAVATLSGAVAITASSSAGDADTFPTSDPGALPYAAFDASLRSAWRPNPLAGVEGAWIAVDFGRPVSLAGGRVVLNEDTTVGTLGLTSERGATRLDVRSDSAELPAVTTRWLRLSLESVGRDATAKARDGIRSISVPGVNIVRSVALPTAPTSATVDEVRLHGDVGRPGCLWEGDHPYCGAGIATVGEDAGGLVRQLDLADGGSWTVDLRARVVASPDVESRVAAALKLPVAAEASSRAVPDLVAGPQSAVDGYLGTSWVAAVGDPDPRLVLTFGRARTLTSVQVLLANTVGATPPTSLRLVADDGTVRQVPLDADGHAAFAALTTKRLTVHLEAQEQSQSIDPYTAVRAGTGVGISELAFPGVTPTIGPDPVGWNRQVTFACGAGPALRVGDRSVPTRLVTSVGALMRNVPLTASVCGLPRLTLSRGTNQISAGGADRWDVTDLSLVRSAAAEAPRPSAPPVAAVAVTSWDSTRRTLKVGSSAGPTLVVVHENTNLGWTGHDGRSVLRPVTVNGWQQGWEVAAGPARSITLTFGPDSSYRAGLLAGVGLALLLLGLAAAPARRVSPAPSPARGRWFVAAPLGVVLLTGGPWSALVIVAVFCLDATLRRWHRSPLTGDRPIPASWPAFASYALAGTALLVGPFGSAHYRANDTTTQVLCLVALTFVLLSVARPVRPVRGTAKSAQQRTSVGAPSRRSGAPRT